MIKTFVKCLENPERPFLGPNYKFLQLVGLILPKSKVGKAAYILFHQSLTYFVITEFMELYVIRTDMQEVIKNLTVTMLGVVTLMKCNTIILWQNKWIELLDYVTEVDKFERHHKDKITGKIIDKYTKYCRRVTYIYCCLSYTTFLVLVSTPLVRYLSSSVYREQLRNGTELFPQMFSSWMPFDKYHSPGCWMTVFWYVFMSAYGASMAGGFDTIAIVLMVFFGGHLELLRERCKKMMGSVGNGISDAEAGKVLRQIHGIHTLLTKYSRLFNSLLSPVMFVYVVVCSLMLCTSIYQFSTATTVAQKLLMAEYLVYGVSQLLMFCWHSNDVLMKSENVSLGPYESQWWAASVRQKKSVLIILGQLRVSYIFTAGPFTDLTLATFVTILKGAYSYYTVLKK